MLTRLRFKLNFRLISRCLSDSKGSDKDGKVPEVEPKGQDKDKKSLDPNTAKIQELLKGMMAARKVDEREYREKFATAPDLPRKWKQKLEKVEVKTEKIEESISKAAGDVAQALGGDVKKTEAELLSKVLGKINQTSTSLSDLLIGMKVDRTKESEVSERVETRGQQVKRLTDKSRQHTKQNQSQRQTTMPQKERKSQVPEVTAVNIFSGEPLNIFKVKEPNYGTKLEMWEEFKQRELTLATTQPPANYFQKMILWTEQGKVWKFPINNEQGWEDEENVHFSEHVFLDQHLEGWCPKRGPIRHFMELVCVGLSKNPFYTVQEKIDHIMWYKEYFESKKDLLTEIGAWDAPKASSSEAST